MEPVVEQSRAQESSGRTLESTWELCGARMGSSLAMGSPSGRQRRVGCVAERGGFHSPPPPGPASPRSARIPAQRPGVPHRRQPGCRQGGAVIRRPWPRRSGVRSPAASACPCGMFSSDWADAGCAAGGPSMAWSPAGLIGEVSSSLVKDHDAGAECRDGDSASTGGCDAPPSTAGVGRAASTTLSAVDPAGVHPAPSSNCEMSAAVTADRPRRPLLGYRTRPVRVPTYVVRSRSA